MIMFCIRTTVAFLLTMTLLSSVVWASDTSKVKQLNAVAMQLYISDPNQAIDNLEEALLISQQNDFLYGQVICYRNLGIICLHENLYSEAVTYLSRGLHFAQRESHFSEIATISLYLGKAYNFLGDKQNALFYLDKAQKFFSVTVNTDGLYEVYQMFSMVYQSHNEYYQALHYGIEALKISRNLDDKEHVIQSLGNLAQIYYLLNQQQKAVEHYLQAISLAELGVLNSYLPILYINTGILYRDIKQYPQSVQYFLKAYDCFQKLNNSDGMIAALTETGKSYKEAKVKDKALNYFLRAKTLAEKENNYPRILALNEEISQLYIQSGNFHKALVYLDLNFNIAKQLNDRRIEARALYQIGYYFLLKGDFQKSADILRQSLAIAGQSSDLQLLSDITFHLSSACYKSGDADQAYRYLKMSKVYSDKRILTKEADTYAMLQSVFEISNKEKELELLRKTNDLERLEKQKAQSAQKRLFAGVITLIALLGSLAYVLLLIRRKNRILKIKGLEIEASNLALLEMNISLQKQKEQLNHLNNSLSESNRKLTESEEKLTQSNAAKDKLFSIISHDLRSPFASISSYIKLMKKDLKKMKHDEILNLTNDLEKNAENVNILLENLLQWSLTQSGKLRFNPENLNLKALVLQELKMLHGLAEIKNISITVDISSESNVLADRSMISTVIRNLVSNAIKFSSRGQKVQILGEEKDGLFSISVIDTGSGMTPAQMDAILSGKSVDPTPDSDNRKSSGLGLFICHEFLEKHETKLMAFPNKKQGTIFQFELTIC